MFLEQRLPSHFRNGQGWIDRINQKINPSSLEILRLIRDFDFEIEEYDLVLSESVFKAYRHNLELEYAELMSCEGQTDSVEGASWIGSNTRRLVVEREDEKRVKRSKFMSF